ncbi:MAG: tetratricopeptide repeat protein [Myxococcales bacterium]|nr:tetratricopeptide repeat protein [Myxococcales bacterium]
MERKPLNELETQEILRIQAVAQRGTHYDALGLDLSARKEDVEGAYHTYVRQWHPDRFFNRDAGELHGQIDENFAAVTKAFRVLRDPAQRNAYDAELRAFNRAPTKAAPAVRESGQETSGFEVTFRKADKAGNALAAAEALAAAAAPAKVQKAPNAVEKIRQQLQAQLVQARRYYEAGKLDYDAGNWVKSEGNLYLATRYDPQNQEYQALHSQAATKGRHLRATALVSQAEQAEGFGQTKEAVAYYRKAIQLDPPDGRAYFRLAQILRTQEDDMRSAVELYRKAVTKDARNIEYHVVLAEVYEGLGLKENARKLAIHANALDRSHAGAQAVLKRLKS